MAKKKKKTVASFSFSTCVIFQISWNYTDILGFSKNFQILFKKPECTKKSILMTRIYNSENSKMWMKIGSSETVIIMFESHCKKDKV